MSRETMLDSEVEEEPSRALRLRLQRDEVHQRLFGEPVLEPHRIGRYLVEGTLGQGGMGTVLRAHDETLGRDVALKVLHDARGGRHDQRLIREAQALAQLSHPNVVGVYDVNEIDGRLCMALELVHGQSLDKWQLQPRPWPEVLGVYRQAGRGLAAAHAGGLVHRDFKPANCILDSDGVVKVLDFGLARGVGAEPEAKATEVEQTQSSASVSSDDSLRASRSQQMLEQALTRTGTMLGTLAYMAPEQLMGQPAAPASDQFSFCVALYEALHGVRPFGGTSAMTILYSIQSAEPDGDMARKGLPPVPKWVLEVLRRGLAVASHKRFESMEALLGALERQLVRRRRLRRAAMSVVVLGGLGGALAASGVMQGERPCDGLQDVPMPAWSTDDRGAVRAAFEGSGLPGADAVHERVEQGLDTYAQAWTEARADACEATWVRREAGEQVLSRRMACLDDRLPHVRATVDELASADVRTAAHATAAVAALPSLEPCADVEALLRGPAPVPAELAEEAAEVRELIARSWASGATGHDDGGMNAAQRAVEAAEALAEAPVLRLEALHNRGHVYRRTWRLADARVDLGAALALAERLDDQSRAVDVLRELILVADDDKDTVAASAWLTALRGKLERFEHQPYRRAQRWDLEARIALRDHRMDEALSSAEQATALFESLDPGAALEHVEALLLLGSIQRRRKDIDGARRSHDRAQALAERDELLPLLGRVRYRQAYLDYVQGHLDPARETLRSALASDDAFFGSQAVTSIRSRLLLAQLLRMQGKMPEALEQVMAAQRSMDDRVPKRIKGEEANLRAGLLRGSGQIEDAIAAYREARVAWQSEPRLDRVMLAMLDTNIADCLVATGELDAAIPLYDHAFAVLEVETDPEDSRRAYPLLGRALLALEHHNTELAIPMLRQALALPHAAQRDPSMAATARWALARALISEPSADAEDSIRAGALAHDARDFFVKVGANTETDSIDAWFAECGPPCASLPSNYTPQHEREESSQ